MIRRPPRSTLFPYNDALPISKLDEAIGWARKYSIFQYPFVTACCGMEYMATACSHYDVDRYGAGLPRLDRKSTRLNSSHGYISYAVFCLKKRKDVHRESAVVR